MRAPGKLVLVGLLLGLSAHLLPAPIVEAPEQQQQQRKPAAPRIENHSRTRQTAVPPTPKTPTVLFAGSWSGKISAEAHTLLGRKDSSSQYSIQISPDEKTISVEENGNSYGNLRQSQIACRREGGSLIWDYEQKTLLLPRITGTGTLRINTNGTAALTEDRRYHSLNKCILKISGALRR